MNEIKFVYIPSKTREEEDRNPRYDRIKVPKPSEVWELPLGQGDASSAPDASMKLVHGVNAWIHEQGHDWYWNKGFLQFSPGGERQGGIWICLVYK